MKNVLAVFSRSITRFITRKNEMIRHRKSSSAIKWKFERNGAWIRMIRQISWGNHAYFPLFEYNVRFMTTNLTKQSQLFIINYLNQNMEQQFAMPFTHGIINGPKNFLSILRWLFRGMLQQYQQSQGSQILCVHSGHETIGSDTASYSPKDSFFTCRNTEKVLSAVAGVIGIV